MMQGKKAILSLLRRHPRLMEREVQLKLLKKQQNYLLV
jgi:hypothetical protein